MKKSVFHSSRQFWDQLFDSERMDDVGRKPEPRTSIQDAGDSRSVSFASTTTRPNRKEQTKMQREPNSVSECGEKVNWLTHSKRAASQVSCDVVPAQEDCWLGRSVRTSPDRRGHGTLRAASTLTMSTGGPRCSASTT